MAVFYKAVSPHNFGDPPQREVAESTESAESLQPPLLGEIIISERWAGQITSAPAQLVKTFRTFRTLGTGHQSGWAGGSYCAGSMKSTLSAIGAQEQLSLP
jgi:hypothetical protein